MKKSQSRLLERAFKLSFGLKLCVFTMLGGAAVVALLYLSLSKGLGETYSEAIYTIHDIKIRALPLVFASSYSVLVLGLVTAAIAAISLFFSHRIAGPLFRMEKNLEAIASGDLTVNTRFRGDDQLSILADELNSMVRSVNHAARSMADSLEELSAAEGRLRALLDTQDAPEAEVAEALASVRDAVEAIKKTASDMKARQ